MLQKNENAYKYKSGNYWYGYAKLELLYILLSVFKESREKYNYYLNNYDEVLKKMEYWNRKVDEIASEKYNKMMEIIWL